MYNLCFCEATTKMCVMANCAVPDQPDRYMHKGARAWAVQDMMCDVCVCDDIMLIKYTTTYTNELHYLTSYHARIM